MQYTAPSKKDKLFIALFGFFLTNALLAELIGVKIFSLEALMGIPPVQITISGYKLDFNLTAGVVLWPVVFVVSDIINEYFGKEGVKRISYITSGLILFAFFMVYAATKLPPAAFWMEINKTDKMGNPFDVNYAYGLLFGQGLGIIVGSLIAFLIGQIVDATVFHHIRTLTNEKHVWLRATGSTIISQLIDSYVVLLIAFYFLGNWQLDFVLAVGTMNFIYKLTVAILLIPFLYLAHYLIDKYLAIK